MTRTVHQLVHGYQKGHTQLAGSCSLPKSALEIITEQSDLSGPLPAGVYIPPHIIAYPVPGTDFYAIGKAWPDVDAPRSGCVITHTLLIPMDEWETVAHPATYLTLHRRPDRQTLDEFRIDIQLPKNVATPSELTWLNASEAGEFVTKVFSDGLRSVIWFDCEAPDLLVMSLASLLWPSLRATLYAHTFSLHAHAKVKSDLQLHFAPRNAQSHFARVPKQCHMGRRPERNQNEPKQEWISELAENLVAGGARGSYLDGLNNYGHLLGREPSTVRNLFALRELTSRMSHSPTAAIGILDIIDSLEPAPESAVREKKRALDMAVTTALAADSSSTLQCLSLIDVRLRRPSYGAAKSEVPSRLRDSVENIVAKEPQVLIATCGQNTPSEDSFFWQGAINGMRTAAMTRPNSLEALGQSATIASFTIRFAPSVARAYLLSSKRDRPASISDVVQWLRNIERDDQRLQLRRELLPVASNEEGVPLLEELLRDVSDLDVESTLDILVEATRGFENASIRRVVTDFICQRFPEETIDWGQRSQFLQSKYVPEVIAEAFPLSAESIDRIFTVSWMTHDDCCEIWSAFIERLAQNHLPQWFVRRASEDVMIIEPFTRSELISSRAMRALQAIGEQCEYLPLARSTHFQEFIRKISESTLAQLLIARAWDSAITEFVRGRIDAERMELFLTLPECDAWSHEVHSSHIHGLLTSNPDRDAWQRAWTAYSTLPTVLFRKIAGNQLVADFTRSYHASWTEEVANAWVKCIVRANQELSYESSLRMQMESTSFCLNNSRFPVGAVVCQTFPSVYEAVSTGKAAHITDEMFGYFDWDKAKKLRKDLIDAYLSSCWPPEDLAVIAAKCQILRKVLHRLQRRWSGDGFIQRMLDGLAHRESLETKSLRAEIVAAITDPSFFEPWD